MGLTDTEPKFISVLSEQVKALKLQPDFMRNVLRE